MIDERNTELKEQQKQLLIDSTELDYNRNGLDFGGQGGAR